MPRAKKTTTKTDKKVVAKKQTVQDIEKIIKKQVQEQLEEALLNIEIESPNR